MIVACIFAFAVAMAMPATVSAEPSIRDASKRAAFVRENPCPVTGKTRGRCPGYVVDHIEPLCAGGADHPHNMQWQTLAAAKAKDNDERRRCRAMRR